MDSRVVSIPLIEVDTEFGGRLLVVVTVEFDTVVDEVDAG